ncbi:hypothetical protein [Streptomyces sp. MBT53]|uniref:hypothetical protein n=1 Tax=Streptomyces sp. MBT53 TaxID=1488384 RepID=UPI001911D027|nr:hypothetical protein [Streptomyces sp. MBT53]MBK6019401.1 hypothetical protein [Streptomyces sp. MBT53]
MFPTTGLEASFTVALVAIPVFNILQLLIPRCFGTSLEQELRDRYIRWLVIFWPVLLLGTVSLGVPSRRARADLGMPGGPTSTWPLWTCTAVAALFVTATAAESVRAARAEARLRPVAEELLQDAQQLQTWLGMSTADEAQSAQYWLDEAQEALDARRGRTSVRYLRHALRRAEDTARHDAERVVDAAVVPFDDLRHRVDQADELVGPFSGPLLKS